ncbi:MAG: hypothetical protein GXO03_05855 [Aquificae bacterium]|nr:hypothetical protein [Aquificota bacterium]
MELWVKIDGEKRKYQGSFKAVMEKLVEEGKGKKVELLSFHAPQKERRRLKRELRAHGKDLLKTASYMARWFYQIEERRLRRRIKELKKKAKRLSKGELVYDPKKLEQIKQLEQSLERVRERIKQLVV